MLLFIGGIIALGTNRVYWVELFGVDWSYTGSLAWQTALTTLTVVAALHVVCKVPWRNEKVLTEDSRRITVYHTSYCSYCASVYTVLDLASLGPTENFYPLTD